MEPQINADERGSVVPNTAHLIGSWDLLLSFFWVSMCDYFGKISARGILWFLFVIILEDSQIAIDFQKP